MHEIVTRKEVNTLFDILVIVTPLVGAGILLKFTKMGKHGRRGVILGVIVALLGPMNWLLWVLYNSITSIYGLDTVKNLVINSLLFVALGLLFGWLIRLSMRYATRNS